MPNTTLDAFIAEVRSAWGPLTTALADECRRAMEALAAAPPSEPWVAGLLRDAPASRELYRDPAHGFVLMAHTEAQGLYRPPHDHGRAWVIYAALQGEIEIGTYARIEAEDGSARLVRRDSRPMRAGEARVYLPGDIHDTRCLTPSAVLLRFTERDLKVEDRIERRLTRYVERGGVWTTEAAPCPAW
ncbi:MAG TPA: hypothetical protein VG939_11345 [Caulobacteraceae bacterium]|nr:hypothetical protein [Caulobacteraceae bacterium]